MKVVLGSSCPKALTKKPYCIKFKVGPLYYREINIIIVDIVDML
jgi:hypothetical protein